MSFFWSKEGKLISASKKGSIDTVRDMLNKGVDVNSKTKTGYRYTSLIMASSLGHIEVVDMLLAKGADPNIKGLDGLAPLHCAVLKGYKDIMGLLISNGVDVNIKGPAGVAPLHIAVGEGYKDIVDLLISNGVNVNQRTDNDMGTTALFAAFMFDFENSKLGDLANGNIDFDMMTLLLAKGADPNIKRKNDGVTVLQLASAAQQVGGVKQLLDKGANPNVKDDNGDTSLFHVIRDDDVKANDILSALIANGADVNVTNNAGVTPLMIASVGGYENIITMLLAEGADVSTKDNDGKTALKAAQDKGHKNIIKHLQISGAK